MNMAQGGVINLKRSDDLSERPVLLNSGEILTY